MLRKTLGEENWWRAINYYLRKYAHQPVSTEQFRIAIEESTGQSMDWFFDEWLYKMGHPVFRISQSYDDVSKTLTLKVDQVQKPDPASRYPQVDYFQMPIDVEIGTEKNTVIERITVQPKETQAFTFKVNSKPVLVNFDFNQTVIKELEFSKPVAELVYQAHKDQDVLGRIWAIAQLKNVVAGNSNDARAKQEAAEAIEEVLRTDVAWPARVEAAGALTSVKTEAARTALIAATKDKNARVRARATSSLGELKDPALASVFKGLLNDQSYAVIRSAAVGLGQTKTADAFQSLSALIDTPSWRNTIRASALSGMAALGDKRAVDLGLKYLGPGNESQVRGAAVRLIAAVGKSDPRTFQALSEFATKAVERVDFSLTAASLEALATLGDIRGLTLMEQLSKTAADIPQFTLIIRQYQERLQKTAGGARVQTTP
jgi:aminopeptidase N